MTENNSKKRSSIELKGNWFFWITTVALTLFFIIMLIIVSVAEGQTTGATLFFFTCLAGMILSLPPVQKKLAGRFKFFEMFVVRFLVVGLLFVVGLSVSLEFGKGSRGFGGEVKMIQEIKDKMQAKYQDKGFQVINVQLDKPKDNYGGNGKIYTGIANVRNRFGNVVPMKLRVEVKNDGTWNYYTY